MISDPRKHSMRKMVRILEYLECPQYLRKTLFPIQRDLDSVGLINPLECEHHFKIDDIVPYREGVVTNKFRGDSGPSLVNVGLRRPVEVDRVLQPNVRVTVKLDLESSKARTQPSRGKVVSPNEPREVGGYYWGYSIRATNSLHEVFDACPFEEGYDLLIGTSDRGDNVDKTIKKIPRDYQHLLIVFGGLKGIEGAHERDESLAHVKDCKDLFHFYLNTCPNQGSDTIRTEVSFVLILQIAFITCFDCFRRLC